MNKALCGNRDFILCHSFWEILDVIRAQLRCSGNNVCVIPIGAQGAGKSTLGKYLSRNLSETVVISLDELRLGLYEECHRGETADYTSLEGFLDRRCENIVRKRALDIFRSGSFRVKYIDKMNLTSRSRRPFLLEDNVNIAVVFDVPLEALLLMHGKRSDKRAVIEEGFVKRSFYSLQLPHENEFDLVIRYMPDLPVMKVGE